VSAWPASPPFGRSGPADRPDLHVVAVQPAAWWYLTALVALVVGVVGGVALVRNGVDDAKRTARQEFTTYPVNERGTVSFDAEGSFTMYFEGPSALVASEDVDNLVAKLDIRFVEMATGETVPLAPYETYDASSNGGIERVPIKTFRIDRPGDYLLEVRTTEFPAEASSVSVGPSPYRPLLLGLFIGCWFILAGLAASVTAIVAVSSQRGRSKRATSRLGAGPPPGAWPGAYG
jgi:hypothetical protein